LSSNFPIHLFDSPLPRWPTFGINLGGFDRGPAYDPTDQSKNVWMPPSNNDSLRESWTRFKSPLQYVNAMLGAVKDWNDNIQMKTPGYRDRIVTVKLQPSEGGLNLDMEAQTIRTLAARGKAAGELLVERFSVPSTGAFLRKMDWENQRWVRYRVTMSAMQRFLRQFTRGLSSQVQPGDVTFSELIERGADAAARPPYPWKSKATRDGSPSSTDSVSNVGEGWTSSGIDFEKSSPAPAPDLVKRAKY
jgi:hypothetical protein